jgi:glutamine cyclotransferase
MILKTASIVTGIATITLIIIIISSQHQAPLKTPVYTYQIINTYPHDPQAFTQGLFYHNGFLYESTGLQDHSSLRKVVLETGQILQIYHLPRHLFGEGITLWQDSIIQLTWTSQKGIVYQLETFEPIRQFHYRTQGWGITHNDQQLIMSDGTNTLHILDANNFKEIDRIQVHDNNKPVYKLNELEYIKGEIFANVWESDYIARISPSTGQVLAWIDLSGLIDIEPIPDQNRPQNVLNGIAYDVDKDRLFVTGKLWPSLFEIKLVQKSGNSHISPP